MAGTAHGSPGGGVGGVAPDTAVPASPVRLLLPLQGQKGELQSGISKKVTRDLGDGKTRTSLLATTNFIALQFSPHI